MERRLFLDVVVAERAAVFELFAREDETLLVGRDPLFILDLRFDVLNRVARFHFERDRFSRQCFDEDLHASSQAEHQVKRRLFLDVVVAQSAAVFELFASENEALLVGRDPLFVLDLGFDVFDGVARFHFERDCLSCQCFDEDLHSTSQAEH